MNRSLPAPTVLLRLRWLQLRRAMSGYGLVLLALVVIGVVVVVRKAVIHDASLAPYIAGGAVLLVFGMHQRRRDHHFLHYHVARPRIAMVVEYGTMLLPVLIGLLLAQTWVWSAALALALCIPWTPVVQGSGVRAAGLRKLIPSRLFEWKSLLQSTHPVSVLLWLAALAFCWLPVLPLFLVGIIAMMVVGAQETCEPRTMLLATAHDARSLLHTKVAGALRLMAVIVLPVLLSATCFHPNWWWVHALYGVGLLVLVAYAIVLKYANYRPNARLEANGAHVTVAAVFAMLPGLSLVPLVMLATEWPKARANLNAYFHDHHR